MNNIVRRNDVFDTHQLEEYFEISKSYNNYGTSHTVQKTNRTQLTKRYPLRIENDDILHSIEPFTANTKKRRRNPIKQETERSVKMTNNQREYSFERKNKFS